MHKYTDLEVYRHSVELTASVRRAIRTFPREERETLGMQLSRAVDSIVLNIAEGAGCDSATEFARFLTYAIRSAFECKAAFDIAVANALITRTEAAVLSHRTDRIIAMLYGLQKHLRRR